MNSEIQKLTQTEKKILEQMKSGSTISFDSVWKNYYLNGKKLQFRQVSSLHKKNKITLVSGGDFVLSNQDRTQNIKS